MSGGDETAVNGVDDLTPPRGRPPVRRSAPSRKKRRITLGLAVAMCVGSFLVGIVLGYKGRGGPGDSTMVTTSQEIPLVTVTQAIP